MNKNILKNSRGFTLMETMLGVLMLALFAIPIASTFFTTARTNASARAMLDATAIANRIVEHMSAFYNGATSPEGEEVHLAELASFGFDISNANTDDSKLISQFEITKKVSIISKQDISSDIQDDLQSGQYLLALDTTVPGKIVDFISGRDLLIFTEQNPTIDIVVHDDSVDIGTTPLPGTYGYICVYTGENEMTLNFINSSTKVKSLYIINPLEDMENNVTIPQPIVDTMAWNVFDNLKTGAVYPLCEIALVDIKINVRHIRSGLSYETTTQKPIYSFSFAN